MMDLHLTLAAGPGVILPSGSATEEVVADTAVAGSGASLHRELAALTGASHFSVGSLPLGSLTPGDPPLTNGAVVVAAMSPIPADAAPAPPANLFFAVKTGPDAGRLVPLVRGIYRIGRAGRDITINDPELSRTHAILTVTNDAITIADSDSANGVWIDGFRVQNATVTADSAIRIGGSQCALMLIDQVSIPVENVDLSEPCEVAAPAPPQRNRLLLVTALLPLLLGVTLAVTTGMWFFLAFSALSAVTGLVPLLTGRRKRAAFQEAVIQAVERDKERRRRALPVVAELALGAYRQRTAALAGTIPPPSYPGRYIRLGAADQPAALSVKPMPPDWEPPIITGASLTVPLTEPDGETPLNLTVRGHADTLLEVAQLILLQFAVLEAAGNVVCFGPERALPLPARFLPRVRLVAERDQLDELLASGSCSTLLLFGEQAQAVVRLPGVRIYRFCSSAIPAGGGWTADYSTLEPLLSSPAGNMRFEADHVSRDSFEQIARGLGSGRAMKKDCPATVLPQQVGLSELLDWNASAVATQWQAQPSGRALRAVIGIADNGPVAIDLVADGPHTLVAGTTGSGKSELLRTLALSLGLSYAPTDLNFLFIDFKGGSGLGALAGLPQATGLLTDLSPAAVTRALISLRAEVKRREEMFAVAGATDYQEYRSIAGAPLPRLVIVIDEFRMLSEEVPGSVQELMRIATLGRSLGLHLVLSTQRPQGAVTSDIRANITTSIALRMQTPMESQDVLEATVAATIPLNLSGRAYIRVGGRQPVEFQTATTAAVHLAGRSGITTLSAHLHGRGGAFVRQRTDAEGGFSTAPDVRVASLLTMVDSAVKASAAVVLPPNRVPVLPALPNELPLSQGYSDADPDLGMLDVPEAQEQHRLVWNPEQDAHLAFVGQPAGGTGAALTSAAGQLVRHRKNTHLYVLDGDGSLRSLADLPQTGAYASAGEARRGARILQRVADLIESRLGSNHRSDGAPDPFLAIVVSGWGRWAGSLRSGKYAWAEDALQDIARDGEAAGVTLLIAGDRELMSSRFFQLIPNRLYLPVGISPESLLAWPRMPAIDPVPGRAFVQGRIGTSQGAVAQLVLEAPFNEPELPAQSPFRVDALPSYVGPAELDDGIVEGQRALIPVGVGGDDLRTMFLAITPGATALVAGPPASGRSTALEVIARLCPAGLHPSRLGPASPDELWQRTATGALGGTLLLVDDAEQLPRERLHLLAKLVATGARAVLVTPLSPGSTAAMPLAAAMRSAPLGLVLGARSPSDGDLFGIRLDVDGARIPGRGFLIDRLGAEILQVADLDPSAATPGLEGRRALSSPVGVADNRPSE